MTRLSAVGVGICCLIATQTAVAIWAPLGSAKGVPFQTTYPKAARLQVYSALQADNCKFIKGHSFNWQSRLQFQGDTDAINEMLKQLASCPGAIVTVSFRESEEPGDWRVDYDCRSMKFEVIVNLKSRNIAVDRLAIPAARGPQLESSPTSPTTTK